jgi:hypothetical protein
VTDSLLCDGLELGSRHCLKEFAKAWEIKILLCPSNETFEIALVNATDWVLRNVN